MNDAQKNAISWAFLRGLEWYMDNLYHDISEENLQVDYVISNCQDINCIYNEYRKLGGKKSLAELVEAGFVE